MLLSDKGSEVAVVFWRGKKVEGRTLLVDSRKLVPSAGVAISAKRAFKSAGFFVRSFKGCRMLEGERRCSMRLRNAKGRNDQILVQFRHINALDAYVCVSNFCFLKAAAKPSENL